MTDGRTDALQETACGMVTLLPAAVTAIDRD